MTLPTLLLAGGIGGLVLLVGAFALARSQLGFRRAQFIRRYVFPASVLEGLRQAYPHLDEKDAFLVARALRMFFLVHLRAGKEMIGMPSKAVDALWHAFILDTRAYHAFCRHAFGAYFHHIPADDMAPGAASEQGLWRTWRFACLEENIRPDRASRLPLLFAIDEKLRIPDGHSFSTARFTGRRRAAAGGSCGGGGYSCGGDGGGCGGS